MRLRSGPFTFEAGGGGLSKNFFFSKSVVYNGARFSSQLFPVLEFLSPGISLQEIKVKK